MISQFAKKYCQRIHLCTHCREYSPNKIAFNCPINNELRGRQTHYSIEVMVTVCKEHKPRHHMLRFLHRIKKKLTGE